MITKQFLDIYNDELRYFREAGYQFALSHPQVAQHLGMHTDGVLDPFVERLLEGAAFLSARVQEKLNYEQPEFALQMLSRLAPLWHTPVPSIATISVKPDLSFPQWKKPVDLPKGSLVTLTDPSLNNKSATFTTARHIQVQPVEITEAVYDTLPPNHLPNEVLTYLNDGSAYLRLVFNTHEIIEISDIKFDPLNLTFANEMGRANQLISALLNNSLRIVLWAKNNNKVFSKILSSEDLSLGGISEEESLLPVVIGELPGSRLMREYFASPSRFLSINIRNIQDFLNECKKIYEFELIFVLNKNNKNIFKNISADDFRIFSTPVINLYNRHCSPVNINQNKTEYPIVVDRLSNDLYEIYKINNVKSVLSDDRIIKFSAFQGDIHFDDNDEFPVYMTRRSRESLETKHNNIYLPYRNNFISISQGKSDIDITKVNYLSIDALVCERHLVSQNLQKPKIFLQNSLPVHDVEILRHPSNPVPIPSIDQAWKAIQIISINPLRYKNPDINNFSGLLKDILSIFCYKDNSIHLKRISSIKKSSVHHHFERYEGKGPLAWIRSAVLNIDISTDHHSDHGSFIFGKVLHHALSCYGDLNQTVSMNLILDGDHCAHWGSIHHDQ